MPPASLRLQQTATRAAFFIPGFVIATWAPIVPFAKARAGLDDATLGTVLLCLGLGSLVAMPLAGAMAARLGCRRVMLASVAVMIAALPLLAAGATAGMLGATLFALGAAMGAMDCTMNIQAVAVERDAAVPLMSGFHAFYSIGGLVGGAGVSLLLSLGVSALAVTAMAATVAGATALASVGAWRRERAAQGGPAFVLPHGRVILIGTVCFVTFLAEGSMLDWSAVFLHEVRAVDAAHAGWGFVAFNLAMMATRLVGDRVIRRLGRATAVLAGGAIGAAGLTVATVVPHLDAALAGYALLGIGCANIVPAMFSLAGQQTRMPESLAIPAITTMGYAGVLIGPAAIGYVAQAASLSLAFPIVALALAAAALLGARLAPRRLG